MNLKIPRQHFLLLTDPTPSCAIILLIHQVVLKSLSLSIFTCLLGRLSAFTYVFTADKNKPIIAEKPMGYHVTRKIRKAKATLTFPLASVLCRRNFNLVIFPLFFKC